MFSNAKRDYRIFKKAYIEIRRNHRSRRELFYRKYLQKWRQAGSPTGTHFKFFKHDH